MRKLWFPIVLALVLISCPLQAMELENFYLDSQGNINEKIIYNDTLTEWRNLLEVDLQINVDYGYSLSFYLNPEITFDTTLPDNTTVDLQLNEGFIDLYLDKMDLRLGKQLVNWGSAFKQNPTDRINPLDLTASDPTTQLGVRALKADYYLNRDTIISGVIVGEFIPGVLPESLQNSNIELLQHNIYQQVLALVQDQTTAEALMQNLSFQTTEPELKNIEDLEYAFKLTQRDFSGYDISLSFFSGYEDYPVLDSDLEQVIQNIVTSQPAAINFAYKRTNTIGLDMIGELQGVGLWAEAAFSLNEAEQKSLETLLGGDYTFENNLYTIVQYYYRDQLDDETKADQYVMVHGQLPLRQIHQLTTTLMYDLGAGSILLNPEVQYSLQNNLKLNLGGSYIANLKDTSSSLLGNYGSTQAYLGITYGF